MDILTLSMAKKYVDDTLVGMGALQGDKGDKGDAGKSAYEVWLEAGNTGSEQDFLDSLKGDDATITIDETLDTESTNAIQNKAVAEKFEEIDNSNALCMETLGYTCKNLIRCTPNTGATNRGITFITNNDESIAFSGVADNTTASFFTIPNILYLPAGTYKISGGDDIYGGTGILLYDDSTASTVYSGGHSGLLTLSSAVFIYTTKDGTVDWSVNNTYGYEKEFTIDKPAYAKVQARSVNNTYTEEVNGTIYAMIRRAEITDGTWEQHKPSIDERLNSVAEILHTDLTGSLTGVTTVLGLVNALLEEYRATSPKKPIRFVSGEITKTTLTDLPNNYGLLDIKVAGYDVVKISFAHSSFGFKTLYLGTVNRVSGEDLFSSLTWQKIIAENSSTDPYSCTGYTVLTGTEDLFTLPCGHYVSANINTAYNYPITDSSSVTAHIYVLGCLNDHANNKGYRIIFYFDNKGRMYRINEWWGSFNNGWQEIATKTATTLEELGLTSSATIQDVMDKLAIGGSCLIRTDAFTDRTQFADVEWGYLSITKTVNGLCKIEICDITSHHKLYYGRQASGKFAEWVQIATVSYVESLIANL